MSRRRKSIPKEVQAAQQRINGMKSVDERLDLGNGISVETMEAQIKRVTDRVNAYNSKLASLDEDSNMIDEDVNILRDMTTRVLSGVIFKFGGDSNECEMVGGTRRSDRKKPIRKKTGGTGEMK